MPPCAADPCCAAFEDDGTLYDELTGTPLYTKSYDDGSQHDAGCAAAATAPLAGFDASCGAAGCAPPASSLFGDQLCGCGVDFSGDEDEFVRGGARFAAPPAEVPRIPRDPRSQFPGGLPLVTIPLEFPSAMDWASSDGGESDGGERKAKKQSARRKTKKKGTTDEKDADKRKKKKKGKKKKGAGGASSDGGESSGGEGRVHYWVASRDWRASADRPEEVDAPAPPPSPPPPPSDGDTPHDDRPAKRIN